MNKKNDLEKRCLYRHAVPLGSPLDTTVYDQISANLVPGLLIKSEPEGRFSNFLTLPCLSHDPCAIGSRYQHLTS